MNKIPVWKTIAYAYSFTFGHLATIVGLVWIPTLAVSVANFFVSKFYYEAMLQSNGNELGSAGGAALAPFILEALGLLVAAIISVAITREALGMRKPGHVFAYFALGPTEFRVLGALLIFFGLTILFTVGYLIALFIVVTVASVVFKLVLQAAATPVVAVLGATIAVAGFMALIYALMRLSYLIIPVTILENRIGAIRSWELTKGNFWRIFLIFVATAVPAMLIFTCIEVLILGPENFLPPLDAWRDQAALAKFSLKQAAAAREHLPLTMGLNFLAAPILSGLLYTPNAIAYRALVPPGSEPVVHAA